MHYELIVIGVSAGGLHALSTILPQLSSQFSTPIMIVQHMSQDADGFLVQHLNNLCALPVLEAEDKMFIESGKVYVAPGGLHLLVEDKSSMALSGFPKVNFSRPSIDVLFESAAPVFKKKLMGIILTGANSDGVEGCKKIKKHGGFVLVQSIKTAESKIMPSEAIANVSVDKVLDLENIGEFLNNVSVKNEHTT